ncbi:MAG: DUF3710 domain-containing protein [Pseudonocardiaceae bacterium]
MFGRRRRADQNAAQPQSAAEDPGIADRVIPDPGTPATGSGKAVGPYDVDAEPDDGWVRLDLGSLRLPVPEGAQLQVEVDSSGPVRAVHLMTDLGQITLTAFAAPRSGGLWREVLPELLARLRADGAGIERTAGEWGEEVEAVTEQGVLRFLAVDGPRWMLRGVAAGPAEGVQARIALLRDVVRQTVVVRGSEPLPVRSPLPLRLPGPLEEQLKQATAELVNATPGSDPDTGLRG